MSVVVYLEIEILKDPVSGPVPTILPPGTQMRLGCFVPRLSRPCFLHHLNQQHVRHICITSDKTWYHPPNQVYFSMELQLRLHSNNHSSCVGVNNVQGQETTAGSLLHWRPQMKSTWRPDRRRSQIKRLDEAATYPANKEAPSSTGVGRVTMMDICGGGDRLVLWHVIHVRLGADRTASHATPAPSPNPNASATYNGDADFFATEAPCHVVASIGKNIPRSRKKLG